MYKTLQLIHDLYDKEIHDKVLAAGATLGEGVEMTLSEVTKMVQAAEIGKTTYKQLSTAGGICRLSDHQRSKGSDKTSKFQSKNKSKDDKSRSSCKFCRREMHERDQCPAKEASCSKCGKVGHFASKCYRNSGRADGKANYTKSNKVGEVKEAKEVSVNTLSQDFF